MALTGIQIFKLLPKTNCGECGVPTCLAFAMNLAVGQSGTGRLSLCFGCRAGTAGCCLGPAHPPAVRGLR